MRALLGLVVVAPLTACITADDSPTLSLSITQDGQTLPSDPPSQSLLVIFNRPYGHAWSEPVTAVVNGVDAGELTLSDGHEAVRFREAEAPAAAYFRFPMARIERALQIDIAEGSEHFIVDVPDFNAPRAIHLHTPVDALHADEWIELDSGVATDELNGGFVAELDNGFCFTQWGQARSAGGLQLKLPPQGTLESCGTNNTPGSSRTVDLRVSLSRSLTPIATCEGAGLTCNAVTAPAVEEHFAATLLY